MSLHPLEDLLYSQDRLHEVCAGRSLTFRECAHMNEFHGNAGIMRAFASLPEDPLPFALEHAIPYDLDAPYDYDLHSGLPSFLAVHERSAALYRQGEITHSEPIGFSFLYAMQVFQQRHPQAPQPQRRGTLVFPDKSTLLMDTDFDREAFAARLVALPEQYQPVVVCIYWKDFSRGTHEPFSKAGLPVVSAGHTLDEQFPLRLYDLCRRFKYSCANDIAGSFTLSVLAGCHFFHLPTGKLTQSKHGRTEQHEQDPTLNKPMKQACLLASPFPPRDPAEQQRLARDHAGVKHLRDAAFIRRCYEAARMALLDRQQPMEIDVMQPPGRLALLCLLPTGFDSDGVAHRVSSLFIAHSSRVGRVKLTTFDDKIEIIVLRGHLEIARLTGKRSHTVTLDFAPTDEPQRITFVASAAAIISAEDPRERSYFLRHVELRPQLRQPPRRPGLINRTFKRLRDAF
jgi:hypothetical protein